MGFLRIMNPTYAVAVFFVLPVLILQNRPRWRKIFLCIFVIFLILMGWRLAVGIGSKRYAAIFIFPPAFVLGLLTSQAKSKLQKWFSRIVLVIVLAISGTRAFFYKNRYSAYTLAAASKIREDLQKYPGTQSKIVSFMNKGKRIGYWVKTENVIVNENVDGPPFYALRLNLNYWKYASDITYVIFQYPTEMPPPGPRELLLNDRQWEKIHESFVDNRLLKKAYVFRYLPERDDGDSFEPVAPLENGNVEKVSADIGFAKKLLPLNPEYYSHKESKLFPCDWNILLPGYFMPGSKPEISCTTNSLSGKYSLRLASEKSIFIYNSHAVNIADNVYLSFEAFANRESRLNIWMITASERDQITGCFHKKIAVVPLRATGPDGKSKYFFRLEPCADGKNRWARMAIELDHGEVILDNFQLVRKKEKATP